VLLLSLLLLVLFSFAASMFPLICLISISFRCHLWHNDHERLLDTVVVVVVLFVVVVVTVARPLYIVDFVVQRM